MGAKRREALASAARILGTDYAPSRWGTPPLAGSLNGVRYRVRYQSGGGDYGPSFSYYRVVVRLSWHPHPFRMTHHPVRRSAYGLEKRIGIGDEDFDEVVWTKTDHEDLLATFTTKQLSIIESRYRNQKTPGTLTHRKVTVEVDWLDSNASGEEIAAGVTALVSLLLSLRAEARDAPGDEGDDAPEPPGIIR